MDEAKTRLHNPTPASPCQPPVAMGRLLTLLASAILIVACGGGAASTTESTTGPTDSGGDDALSVVLLMSGPANDGGFYQEMADGLKEAADTDGSITVTVREKLGQGGDAALENAVREAAASGDFDLVVAHGFDLVPAVGKFAPEFPDQSFATSLPAEGDPANVSIYLSNFEEIGYVGGFLAATGTNTGRVGFISGQGLPFELESEAGFRQAVAEYAPDAEVEVVYTGDFDDPQLGQETARALIEDGVDSIVNWLAGGQSGVYEACASAEDVVCFGNSVYSADAGVDTVLASFASNYRVLLELWAERLRSDTFGNQVDMLELTNNGVIVTDATDAASASRLSDLQASIDEFRSQVGAGEIAVESAQVES